MGEQYIYWTLAALAFGVLIGGWARRWKYTGLVAGLLLLACIVAGSSRVVRMSSCVVAGSTVAAPSGPRAIESLRVGDEVLGVQPDGARVIGTVSGIRTAQADDYFLLRTANAHSVRAAAAHPIACNGGWKQAAHVEPGDTVETIQGPSQVTRVAHRRERVTVIDLEVRACGTFFAGGVLVHNKQMTARSFLMRPPGPEDVIGVWVGWDTRREAPYCRLELTADGKGQCAFWYDRRSEEVYVHRVTKWTLTGDRINVNVAREGSEEELELVGEVFIGMLSLEYFGADGPSYFSPWFGPLHLVREDAARRAAEATRKAISKPR